MFANRVRQVSFAYVFHWIIVIFGILGPLGVSPSRLQLTHSVADNLMQWDSQWFINIGRFGYRFPNWIQETFLPTGNVVPFHPTYRAAAFFPGLPLIVHILSPIGALVLIAILYWWVLWLLFGVIDRERPEFATPGLILFAINPCAIFFSSLYTETFTVLAVLLIVTGLQHVKSWPGYLLTLLGVCIATSVHDLGAFSVIFVIRFVRLRLYLRALGYLAAAAMGPMLYELYLISRFHTPFALLAAEGSWNRNWRLPFVNIIHTIASGAFSLNTLFVLIMCVLAISHIVQSFRRDHRWFSQDTNVVFGMETGLWMLGILILGLCAYIPGYPLMSVLRFFCILWPAYIPSFITKRATKEQTSKWLYLLTGSMASYATFGAALYSHGWFFQ